MKNIHPLLLSVLSALLLFAAWPVSPLTLLIFVAFIPLLWMEQQGIRRGRFFGWTYLTMLIWNILTTWWICNSTVPAGIAAMLANSLLMCIPWIGFYNVKKRMGARFGYPALVVCWLTFEYIHLNWELSWPWLTLGNAFATHPGWVQWYEYTGASGGSTWVLAINILLFLGLRHWVAHRSLHRRYTSAIAGLLIIPFLLSWWLTPPSSQAGEPDTPEETAQFKSRNPNIVIVQPNVDPWDEKFLAGTQEAQLQKLIRLSESRIDSNTTLVVWPETAIPYQLNEDEMKTNRFIAVVWDFLRRHPAINLLTGVEGFRLYSEQNKSSTAFKLPEGNLYLDTYNSAALLDSNGSQIYHKSKLVPGAETLPSFLKFMTPLFEKFGGTTGGYTRQSERTVLNASNHSYHIAPAVCYESIYGEFMSGFIRNGADIIIVITNDGWWGNTAGYRQHENYARLRAIETRRWVARSANTGISCFIDPSGKVIDPQPWDKTTAIKLQVPANKRRTFYVQYGDLLSKGAIILTILLICLNILFIFKNRRRHA